MAETGDWAVYDELNNTTSISFQEIMLVIEDLNYQGFLWISLDGAMTGKWIELVSREFTNHSKWIHNILIDSCTD